MPTVASVPSSVLAPPSSQPSDQKSSGSDSTAFAGLLNAGTSVTPGSGPSGSLAAPAQGAATPTPVDATESPSLQGVIAQVQSLLQAGVSVKTIASTIAQAIVRTLQNSLANGQFAGLPTDAQMPTASTGQSAAQILRQITQYLLQSFTGAYATKPDGKTVPTDPTLNELMTALATTLTSPTKSASSSSKQSQDSFLSGISALLQQLPALLGQMAGTVNASNGADAKKKPVDTTQNSEGNPATPPGAGLGTAGDAATQASSTQLILLSPPTTQATPPQALSPGSNQTSSTQPVASSVAQPDLSAHIAQLALGLASDASTASRSDATQNPPTASDAIVRSLSTPVSSVSSSDLLLRMLERATNAAVLRGDSLDVAQTGSPDILGAIQSALRQLAGGSDVTGSGTAKFAAADTLTASLASSLQNTGIISAPPSSGFGPGQQQTNANTNAANAATLGGTEDLHNIINQIVSGISIRDIGSTPNVRISLTPPQLGEVVVHLSVGADQNVSATITTSTAEARATVLANIPELNRSLQASGLKVSYLGVDLANQGQQYDQKQQEQRAQQRSNRSSAVAATPEVAGQDPPNGPSLLNTVNLQLLNQLV